MAAYMSRMNILKKSKDLCCTSTHLLKKYISVSHNLYFKVIAPCRDKNPGATKKFDEKIAGGPSLHHFIAASELKNVAPKVPVEIVDVQSDSPYVTQSSVSGAGRKVYFETYGCQMNVNDTEIVWSILHKNGYVQTGEATSADVVLIMTCAIREGAEQKIWDKLKALRALKRSRPNTQPKLRVGVLGCMAERLKKKLIEIEQSVDLVAGPDSYRHLPSMLAETESGQTSVNVLLSLDETYADIMPVRINKNSKSAFVSIMRGCDNMCSFCIVPFTRGRERSRPIESIVDEVRKLSDEGIKEVTLLGQNVNSYRDLLEDSYSFVGIKPTDEPTRLSDGFKTIYKTKKGGIRFSSLLDQVSRVDEEMRIRFTSPHPKDFPMEVLQLMKERKNICQQIHLPAQCGSSRILKIMRRGHTREAYLDLVQRIKEVLPDIYLSSDFICGFCGETDEDFEETITLMKEVKYNNAFTFAYSMRQKTHAFHNMQDDVPPEVKQQRLERMAKVFREEAEKLNRAKIGSNQLVLVEGESKRNALNFAGRCDGGTKVIFPGLLEIPEFKGSSEVKRPIRSGDYIVVNVTDANSQTLRGTPIYHTTLQEFDAEITKTNLSFSL